MLELWGGAECTVSRVGDHFTDQLQRTGHASREGDLGLIDEIGFQAFRVPILWETLAADAAGTGAWEWADRRMRQFRTIGVRPIVGLVHHGSGPVHTSLIDDGFAPGLAAHAAAVARRYPWVRDWTPVNEPLTTARFSALYGHWYPHARDEALFWRALLNQVDGVRLSMRAIRAEQPDARLIQTEDLGRTYATAAVRDQAAFDNQRRWMTWDLLCGRVTRDHPLWQRLISFGLGDRLRAIAEDPCAPDIIGINHYLTSDRFLDHRLDRYPPALAGGSTAQRFADIEAVRVLDPAPDGLAQAVIDCWNRYRLPIAITEVHNGSTRCEQLRWMEEAWRTACNLRNAGVDLRAVTAWALFGSDSWNTLLTRPGRYEPGAFDTSSGAPRATALAGLLRDIGTTGNTTPDSLIAQAPGWWRRDLRFAAPAQPRPAPMRAHVRMARIPSATDQPPLLIVGRHGTLARAMIAACEVRGIPHVALSQRELDLTDTGAIADALDRYAPWAVVNASGWVRVDDAEQEEAACVAINASGAGALAAACAARDLPNAHFSSDLVFDGAGPGPYVEGSAPNPLNAYGRSKLAGEAAIAKAGGRHLIVRTAAFFWADSPHSFAHDVVERARRGEPVRVSDVVVSPTHVPDLAHGVMDLLIDGEQGVWHLTHGEALGWDAFARQVLDACGMDPAIVEAVPVEAMGWRAPRPAAVGLASTRGTILPPLEDAVRRFAAAIAAPVPA